MISTFLRMGFEMPSALWSVVLPCPPSRASATEAATGAEATAAQRARASARWREQYGQLARFPIDASVFACPAQVSP